MISFEICASLSILRRPPSVCPEERAPLSGNVPGCRTSKSSPLVVIVPVSRFAALEVPATSFASSENLLFIDCVFVLWLTLIVSSFYASRCCIICRSVLRSFVFDSIVEFFPDLKGISGERLFCSNECLTG